MNLIDRAKNIIINPKTEWDVVANEEPNIQEIIMGYVIPFALIFAIVNFVSNSLIWGADVDVWGIVQAIAIIFTQVLAVFILAFVVNVFAPIFGSQKNMGRAVQLIAYSWTPLWIGGIVIWIGVIVNIYPILVILNILFGLYGMYLLYLGITTLFQTPKNKKVGYFIVLIVVLNVVYFVVQEIFSAIFAVIVMAIVS